MAEFGQADIQAGFALFSPHTIVCGARTTLCLLDLGGLEVGQGTGSAVEGWPRYVGIETGSLGDIKPGDSVTLDGVPYKVRRVEPNIDPALTSLHLAVR